MNRSSLTAQATVATPLGDVLLARTAAGLAGAWFDGQKDHPGALDVPVQPDDALLAAAAQQIDRYLAGHIHAFDLPLDLHGTGFQRAVWSALRAIPRGCTTSYAAIARSIGAPNAVRAVGAAVGRNPALVIVPCHRVIGSDGSLTGYAGGLARKRSLLAIEGVAA